MGRSRGVAVGVALFLALCTLGTNAEAQRRRPRRDAAREEALALFRQSEDEYQAGRFAQAAALLERAWGRFHEPVLLYNLGRAWEGAGEADKAISAYRQYLENSPGASDRRTVEAKIAELQRQVEARRETERRQAEEDARTRHQDAADERRADEEDRAERERRRRMQEGGGSGPGLAPWILVGAGGVVIGAGAIFGVLANSRHAAAEDDPVQATAVDKQDSAETFATLANVSFIAGAVMAAGGATWVLLGRSGDDEDEAEEPEVEQDDRFQDVRAPSLRIAFGPGSVMLQGEY